MRCDGEAVLSATDLPGKFAAVVRGSVPHTAMAEAELLAAMSRLAGHQSKHGKVRSVPMITQDYYGRPLRGA